MAGVKSDKVQFVSSVEKCRNAEIFVDGRTIEVYLMMEKMLEPDYSTIVTDRGYSA